MRKIHLKADPRAEPTHAALVLAVRDLLARSGWLVFVTPRGGLPGWAGMPDLFAGKGGRIVFVEVKVGRDKLSVDQVCCAVSLRDHGFDVVEARSLEDVRRVL